LAYVGFRAPRQRELHQHRQQAPTPLQLTISLEYRTQSLQISFITLQELHDTSPCPRSSPEHLRKAAQVTRSSKPPQLHHQANGNTASTRTVASQTSINSLLTQSSYTDNGGSTLGISGADFAILAGDTRSTSGYNINTRYAPKLFKIGGEGPDNKGARIVLSVVGFAADGDALKERLDTIVKMYKYQHGKPMSVAACAQRLSHILYNKRFFPYYVHAIIGGLDENGVGALYSYDPVGSYEREQCRAAGAAASLIMPFLDNQVNFKNMYEPGSGTRHDLKQKKVEPLSQDHVEDLVRDAFTSAVERHIEVGDGLQMMIITKDGIAETFTPLKKD
jgi:20S proteasome subunit beta 6